MAQYQSGFVLESLLQLYKDSDLDEKFRQMTHYLSHFEMDLQGETRIPDQNEISLASVAGNLISRGLPTFASPGIENIMLAAFTSQYGEGLPNSESKKEFLQAVFRALHIIDPRINKTNQINQVQAPANESKYPDEFFYTLAPSQLGEVFLQLLERGRSLENLVKCSKSTIDGIENYLTGYRKEFTAHNLAFSTEFPYQIDGSKGFVVEIDDLNHDKLEQREIDKIRNDAVEKSGWMSPFRYRTAEWVDIANKMRPLKKVVNCEYFGHLTENFVHPVYNSDKGLAILQLALAPFAVARLQKAIIELVISGRLSLTDAEWKIAVIERDVPCAWLAISDLMQLLNQLLILQTGYNKVAMPDIKLTVFYTNEFKSAGLNLCQPSNKYISQLRLVPLEKFSEHLIFDTLLDVSVLQRSGLILPEIKAEAKSVVKITSAHAIKSSPVLYSAEPVVYNEPTNLYQEEALTYLLKTIFRKEKFKPAQKDIVLKNLNLANFFALLPPAEGKTIACQMVAMLQPGISLFVVPNYILYVDQQFDLLAGGIDSVNYVSTFAKKDYEILNEKQKVAGAQQLFTYVTPDIFLTQNFRDALTEAARQKVAINRVFVDEAHCLSENSHDYQIFYQNIGKSSKLCHTSNGKSAAVMAITSTASYNTVEDICAEFEIDGNQVYSKDFDFGRFDFEFTDVKCTNIFYNTDRNVARSAVGSKKQVAANLFTGKLYFPKGQGPADFQTQMFCPHRGWMFGVSDANNDGLADKLGHSYPELKIGAFTGTSFDRFEPESKTASNQSLQHFIDYKKGKKHILACTKMAGIGVSAPGARHTLFLNMPSSVEGFIQMCGRIAGSPQNPKCTVLYNRQQIKYISETEIPLMNGDEQLQVDEIRSTVDKELVKENHYRAFRGRKREKSVLSELLTGIISPAETPLILVANAVWEEFGETVDLMLFPQKNPFQLQINQDAKTFGFVDYRSFSNFTESSDFDKTYSDQLLTFVKMLIEQKCPKEMNVFKWLRNETSDPSLPGINQVLVGIENGQTTQITIPLRNDRTYRITELLNLHVSTAFHEHAIYELSDTCSGVNDFLEQLSQTANIAIISNQVDVAAEVKKLYFEVRTDHDTFKAIQRLSTLGIVSDFTVNFADNSATITVRKLDNKDYRQNLISYLQRYLSPMASERLVNEMSKSYETVDTQVLLKILIHFVYQHIAIKNLKRIEDIDMLCEVGVTDSSHPELTNAKIRDFLKYYLKARYAGNFSIPNLLADTQNLTRNSFASVLKFIAEVGELRDNWQHLKASSQILLNLAPENHVLLLLNAYSRFLLESENKEAVVEAFDVMVQGFNRLKADEKDGYLNYFNQINTFLEKIYERKPELEEIIAPLLYLKIHSAWLSDFNRKFLEKFESTVQTSAKLANNKRKK
jgi:superfamily II DNA helicase RecQ